MTTLEDLARLVQETHGIDSYGAALSIVEVYLDQIADDPDLWNAATATLTEDGAHIITAAVAAGYEQTSYGSYSSALLEALAGTVKGILERTHERDALIRAALKTEIRRADIAAASGLTEARLYQIRDERRP